MAEPWKRLLPDLVTTLEMSPVAPMYSAGMPPVITFCSWMISVLRLAPKVPVTGSVTFIPSK